LVSSPVAHAQQPIQLAGFNQVDIINFLLNLKYLKATLYSYITTGADLPSATYVTSGTGVVYNPPNQITFVGSGLATTQQITDLFNEMYYDELNQLVDLRALQGAVGASLGPVCAPRQTINMLGPISTTLSTSAATLTQDQAIGLARMLEDLSTSAFANALTYLSGTNLAYAAQVLAVDGLHAGALRLLSIQLGTTYRASAYAFGLSGATLSTETAVSFTGSSTAGQNLLYATLGSVIPVVGNVVSGVGIPAGATITAITNNASATPTGIVNKSTTISGVSSTSGLLPGQPITGTGIPSGSIISTLTATTITISPSATTTSSTVGPTGNVSTGSPIITNISSLSGVAVGQPITGTGIPAGATISSFTTAAPLSITMSANATLTPAITSKPTGVTATGSPIITALSSISGLASGQTITGTFIPANTFINGVGTSQISLMNASGSPVNATGNSAITGAYSINAYIVAGSNSLTPTSAFTGLVVGQTLTNTNIPAGTTITSIGVSTVTMSTAATATTTVSPIGNTVIGSAVITQVPTIAGIVIGNAITGTGIPSGATITAYTTKAPITITISTPASLISTALVTFNTPTSVAITTKTGGGTYTCTGPTTSTVTIPTTEALSIGQSTVTLALPATITGVNTMTIVSPDPQDVAPADLGTAALAAAGPKAIAGTSPPMYQGFFNTAGSATATGSTPAGFAFARSFWQVLAVLYNYNATNLTASTQNTQGGFFPYGVSGSITSIPLNVNEL
jgi:hypothetical protein